MERVNREKREDICNNFNSKDKKKLMIEYAVRIMKAEFVNVRL